jgi:hypothetical protein
VGAGTGRAAMAGLGMQRRLVLGVRRRQWFWACAAAPVALVVSGYEDGGRGPCDVVDLIFFFSN